MGLFARKNQRVVCITTHLDFAPDIQSQSVGLIIDRLGAWSADLPVIIAGDFNASPSSPCHDLLTGTMNPAFHDVHHPLHPATHHGFKDEGSGEHIDWILCRGLADVESCGVFQEKIRGIFPSDHFPVWARWA